MKHHPRTIVVDWLNTIWSTNLPSNSKYLACYLRKFMNSQQDMAWPSYARIQEETGLSSATVCKYLDVLCSEGWLSRERGGPKVNTKYWATFPSQISTLVDEVPQQLSTLGAKVGTLGAKADSTLGAKDELNKVIKQVNKQGATKRFAPPSQKDVLDYMIERNPIVNTDESERFVDHYTSNGWRVGGRGPMKDWKAAVRNWLKNNYSKSNGNHNGQNRPSSRRESLAERSDRETNQILANIEAREAHSSSVEANEQLVRSQVGQPGRASHDGERSLLDGLSVVVPEDGALDR